VYPLLKKAAEEAKGEYIFPKIETRKKGAPIDWNKPQSTHKRAWTKTRKDAGVQCRFHDLRHTCITNALDAGMPPLMASKIFGASLATINRIYDHLKEKRKGQFRSLFRGKFVERETGDREDAKGDRGVTGKPG